MFPRICREIPGSVPRFPTRSPGCSREFSGNLERFRRGLVRVPEGLPGNWRAIPGNSGGSAGNFFGQIPANSRGPPLDFWGSDLQGFFRGFPGDMLPGVPGIFSGSVYNFPWRRFPRFPGIFRGFAPTGIPWVFLGFGISSGFSRADSRRFHGTSPGKCPALSLDVLCERFAANSRGVP